MRGDGDVARITFLKLYPEADANSVMLTGAFFNNGNPPAVIGDSHLGASSGVPAQADRTALGRAAPNPFAEGTVISYQMAAQGPVSIKIYNVEGKLVRTLVDGKVDAGTHSVIWNGIDNSGKVAARGVYFCCMQARGYRATEKIVFVE